MRTKPRIDCPPAGVLLLLPLLLGGCVTDATRGAPRACPVHGARLRADTVRVTGGIPIAHLVAPWDDSGGEASFPYVNRWSYGGCSADRRQLVRVMYCPGCRRAQKIWMRDELPVAMKKLEAFAAADEAERKSAAVTGER